MDLRQLEIVQAVAETGSFTAAGRKLRVSQSAISRQILLLEDELKDVLFQRIGPRIRITPTGDAILRLSQRVFGDIRETVTLLNESRGELTGTLRLAGGMTVCLYVFPALLKEYRRLHPKVEVKVMTGATPRILRMLRTGAADLAFLTMPLNEQSMITAPAMKEEMLLVTHPSHPLTRKKRIHPADLVRQRFVLFEPGSNSRRVLDEFFIKEQVHPLIVTETENVEILKALVRTGLGISIVPYQAVAREVRGGHLFCTRIAGAELTRETAWIYMRSNRVPRIIEEMVKAFDKTLPRLKLTPGPRGRERGERIEKPAKPHHEN